MRFAFKISLVLFSYAVIFSVVLDAQNLEDSLKIRLEAGDSDQVSLNLAKKLFDSYIEKDDPKSLEYAALYLQIAQHMGDSLLIAKGENMIGTGYMEQRNYFMASGSFFKAYSIFTKNNAQEEIASTLLLWAKLYNEQENYDLSRTKLQKAIDIYRQLGDSAGVAKAFVLFGLTYLNTDDYKALDYFEKAFNIVPVDSPESVEIYSYLAMANYNLGKVKEATDYLITAENYYKKNNDEVKLAEIYEKFGDIFSEEELSAKAEDYYTKSLDLFEKYDFKKAVANLKLKLAFLYLKNEDYKKSADYAEEVISYATLYNNPQMQKEAYFILLQIYKNKGDTVNALKYSELYSDAVEKYYKDKELRNFSSFEMNIEINRFDKELELLKVKNEKDKLQLAQKQYKRNKIYAVTLAVIFLLFIIFLYLRFRERKKTAAKLLKNNQILKQEIEDRKRFEAEAQRNEQRYKLLFDQSPIGIINFNENLYITEVNDRFLKIFHSKKKDIIGQHINRIFDRKTVQEIQELFRIREKSILKVESEIPTKEEVVYVSVTVKKYEYHSDDEDYYGGIMILQDLTEQKRAERFYKLNILTKQKLLEKNPDNLILIDKEERIVAIHLPQSPELELKVSKLHDIITEEVTYAMFSSHIEKLNDENDFSQFYISEHGQNFLVRIFNIPGGYLIIISKVHSIDTVSEDVSKSLNLSQTTQSADEYLSNIKDDIKNNLLPVYQNIQRGLSFLMIRSFAEKIIQVGQKHKNNKMIEYGEELLDALNSFNVVEVNKIIEQFPAFISQFMQFRIEF